MNQILCDPFMCGSVQSEYTRDHWINWIGKQNKKFIPLMTENIRVLDFVRVAHFGKPMEIIGQLFTFVLRLVYKERMK